MFSLSACYRLHVATTVVLPKLDGARCATDATASFVHLQVHSNLARIEGSWRLPLDLCCDDITHHRNLCVCFIDIYMNICYMRMLGVSCWRVSLCVNYVNTFVCMGS